MMKRLGGQGWRGNLSQRRSGSSLGERRMIGTVLATSSSQIKTGIVWLQFALGLLVFIL